MGGLIHGSFRRKLFEDRVVSFKNACYGLVFAELTYNVNFNEKIDYTSNLFKIMQNIIYELENNDADYDLRDLNSMGRVFSPTRLVEGTDDSFNVLKIFSFVYLNLFKHDFDYSNDNIEIKKSKDFPLVKYHDKVAFCLANSIDNHIF